MKANEKISFCRICMGHCGVIVETDEQQRLVSIRGDHDDPMTMGYACFKGLKATEAHNSAERILHAQKRQNDGSFKAIPYQQALSEISSKIDVIRRRDGVEAIAGYKGGGAFFTSASVMMLNSFLAALGSPKAFSSVTIDQSSKAVAAGRIGIWPAGKPMMHRGEVFLIVGGNPLLSLTTGGFDFRNPLKRLKDAKAKGLKLIVIDPRKSETAKFADHFLQPLPGEDCSILASLIHIILENNWQDHDFCQHHAANVNELQAAVQAFTPSMVAQRAGISEQQLYDIAKAFAHDASTGAASSATGPDMAANANLAEHLIECLNVICGRFLRESERIDNPGVIQARWPRHANVIPAPRFWQGGYISRLKEKGLGEFGLIDNELPSGILADEILEEGQGQVKCLLVHGGNPASAIPDQRKIVRALQSLELLVSIEPFMTTTAQLSDYILPPTLQYERADLPLFIYESMIAPEPYTRYTAAVCKPPRDSEVIDDALIFWTLAKNLDLKLEHFGTQLNMHQAPKTDDLLEIAAKNAPISFKDLQQAQRGVLLDSQPQFVLPSDPDCPHRFTLLPDDIKSELNNVANAALPTKYSYRLAVRRLRDTLNSACRQLPAIKKRMPYNFVYINPEDLALEAFSDGDMITIASDHGKISAVSKADSSLRRGVISISHGFGGLPDKTDYKNDGSSVNLLISTDRDCETINAMPRMTGIPVNIHRA